MDHKIAHKKLMGPEFMKCIRLAQIFGNNKLSSGSLGSNALAIKNAFEKGTIRERLTLVYTTIFTFLLNEVLDKPSMINKINERLSQLPEEKRFQINQKLLKEETKAEIGRAHV